MMRNVYFVVKSRWMTILMYHMELQQKNSEEQNYEQKPFSRDISSSALAHNGSREGRRWE